MTIYRVTEFDERDVALRTKDFQTKAKADAFVEQIKEWHHYLDDSIEISEMDDESEEVFSRTIHYKDSKGKWHKEFFIVEDADL